MARADRCHRAGLRQPTALGDQSSRCSSAASSCCIHPAAARSAAVTVVGTGIAWLWKRGRCTWHRSCCRKHSASGRGIVEQQAGIRAVKARVEPQASGGGRRRLHRGRGHRLRGPRLLSGGLLAGPGSADAGRRRVGRLAGRDRPHDARGSARSCSTWRCHHGHRGCRAVLELAASVSRAGAHRRGARRRTGRHGEAHARHLPSGPGTIASTVSDSLPAVGRCSPTSTSSSTEVLVALVGASGRARRRSLSGVSLLRPDRGPCLSTVPPSTIETRRVAQRCRSC